MKGKPKVWRCDGCHRTGAIGREPRWFVTIEVKAAGDPAVVDSKDLAADTEDEIRKLLKQMEKTSAKDLQDEVHRKFKFTLCRACQKHFLHHPLPVHHGRHRDPSRN